VKMATNGSDTARDQRQRVYNLRDRTGRSPSSDQLELANIVRQIKATEAHLGSITPRNTAPKTILQGSPMEDNYPTSKSHVGTGQVKTTGASDRSSSDGGGQLLFSHNEGGNHPNNTQDSHQYQREAKNAPCRLRPIQLDDRGSFERRRQEQASSNRGECSRDDT
jgi:hypothetical protein